MTEEYITHEDDWLGMRVGACGTLLAHQLIAINGPVTGHPSLVAAFTDWNQLLIDTPLLPPEVEGALWQASQFCRIRVRRTEDGLEGIALWQKGGVPIPLTSGTLTNLSNEGGSHEQA